MAPQLSTLYMTVIGNTSSAQKLAARIAIHVLNLFLSRHVTS